jgi:hypothetical protein
VDAAPRLDVTRLRWDIISGMAASSPARTRFLPLLAASAVPALLGWAGVASLVWFTAPFLFPRWLFYFFLFAALAGTALPVVWYLNRRFTPNTFPSEGVLWREALEVASLGTFLVWLQAGRMLNVFLGWIFLFVFLSVEILLRVYEQSRWFPRAAADEASGAEEPAAAPLEPENPSRE